MQCLCRREAVFRQQFFYQDFALVADLRMMRLKATRTVQKQPRTLALRGFLYVIQGFWLLPAMDAEGYFTDHAV